MNTNDESERLASWLEHRQNIMLQDRHSAALLRLQAAEIERLKAACDKFSESEMQGLSNEINDFQNIIERQKREIHELQCQQDTPLAFYDISHDEHGDVEYEFSVYPRPGFKPLYTQAVAKVIK